MTILRSVVKGCLGTGNADLSQADIDTLINASLNTN